MPGRNFLTVTGQDELRRLAADIRRHADSRQINADLRKELLIIGRRGAAAVRASVRATPSQGQSARAGRRSLRAAIARATEAKVRTSARPGVVIWVNPGRMPAGEKALPAYLDGIRRGRHPVFGNTNVWRPIVAHPYFDAALRPIEGDLRAAGERVLSDIVRRIE